MVRQIIVNFRGPSGSMETVNAEVPADWIDGGRDVMTELKENPRVRSRIFVEPSAIITAKISEPFDEDQPRIKHDYDPLRQ